MTWLAQMLERVPRIVVYAVAGLIQIALIAYMVADRAGILRTGTDVMLQTRPVDPRDFLRGDYVVLSYDISSIAAGDLQDTPAPARNAAIYVKLAPKPDGFFDAVSVHREPVAVAPGQVLIQGRVIYGTNCGSGAPVFCPKLTVKYGLEQYFVPEGEGRDIESARNQRKVAVVAAVTPSGRAAIKRLIVDGKPVYDEPMF